MRLKKILEWLEELSPVTYAEEWDNVGLLVGDDEQEIKRIVIALDASDSVIKQAVELQADLVLTHHPMIFKPVKQINNHSMIGRRILALASNRIAYYAMHTNFDIKGGMAELAAEKLELTETVPLDVTTVIDGQPEGIGRTGLLKEAVEVRLLAEKVKEQFGLKNVTVYGDITKKVRKVAVCPGSGKSEIENALKQKADILITGDIGHHEGIDAVDMGLVIMDATHYGLEHIFIEFMAGYLREKLKEAGEEQLQIICLDTGSPVTIL